MSGCQTNLNEKSDTFLNSGSIKYCHKLSEGLDAALHAFTSDWVQFGRYALAKHKFQTHSRETSAI